ncbi:MAG: hypothetical protein Roseis2KO_53360 [Roseivirga sp.]
MLLLSLTVLCFSGFGLLAQQKYILGTEQELFILGTSTMHNWEMVTATAEGEGLFTIEDEQLSAVSDFKVQFKGEDLESGRGIMDRNTRRALDTENHPMISFVLTEYRRNEDGSEVAFGDFTAAGVTRKLEFNVDTELKGPKLQITGEVSFKLTDFDIEPPVALAGTLRTGDAVSLEFTLVFEALNSGG